MKLGLSGHKVDRRGRTLKLRDFLRRDFAVPEGADVAFGMEPDADPLGNDQFGVCGLACPAHFERWQDQRVNDATTVDTDAVLLEAQNFGFDPADPDSFEGVYALDVMKRWRSSGLFGLEPIEAFAQVDFYDRRQFYGGTFLLGGTAVCLNLPRVVKAGGIFVADTWDVAADDEGCLGGHMVLCQGGTVNSWGAHRGRILMTWEFVQRYSFDAYAVVSRRGLKDGRALSGLDLDGMREALTVVTG